MKTVVKIINIFSFDDKYIFDAQIIEGNTLLKGHVFSNTEKNLSFEIISVGMSKSIQKENFPLIVDIGKADMKDFENIFFERII